ncbi:sensor histidine kinase [Ramlibacter sp. MMS24-I3-19]|uniref:sensor histidine kinase n=1 Tax=Ramlibacter sp. MMS24-I3-19 TaxID=3416606 RepID=UPI003D063FE2
MDRTKADTNPGERSQAQNEDDRGSLARWNWEQDEHFRYKQITPLGDDALIARQLQLGVARWDLPGARAISEPWSTHRRRLERHEAFSDFEFFVGAANGSPPRYLSETGHPRRDANGRFLGYSGATRDITAEVAQRWETADAMSLLRLAAQVGSFGAWSSDLRTGMTTWSVELQGIHGCPWGRECTNDQVMDLFAPEWREQLATCFAACASSGAPYDLELQALDDKEQRVWVRVIGVAKRDAQGRITHVQGAYQDIQASKQISESNRAWAHRFRSTLDRLSDGFAIIDRSWRITYANPAAALIVGVKLEDALGRSYLDLFPGVLESPFGAHYRAAMERGESIRFEDYYAPLDMWFRISVFPADEGIAISFSDVSAANRERMRLIEVNTELERRVRERTAKLEALNADLEAFSYSVAHDLRSPIGRMAGFAKELQHHAGQRLDERGRHYLARIQASASEMEAMTEGLITLFHVAHRDLDLRHLDLAGLARECVASRRQQGDVDASADITIDDAMPVRADARLMSIAMENLVGNAIKYSRNRAHPVIHIGSLLLEGKRCYFVRDNGVGFEPEASGALFKPFSRLHASEFEGSGIGLATVHKIIALHRGRVWAESAVGAGATFYFTVGTEDDSNSDG